ncbi:MAG: outer membrane beta-barrel protein [Fimbriimonadaceae bacterium]|nr:outer membrane beta-barrel protein [Chitinophagales bacterium]
MKRQALILLFILIVCTVHAQRYPQGKGTFRTGGGFSFAPVDNDDESSTYRLSLTPNVGYFISDEALIGLGINYSALFGGGIYESSIRLSPSTKYYFIFSKQKFLTANFTYNFDLETNVAEGIKTIDNNTSISLGPGASYFFTRRIGIEATLLYTYFLFPDESSKNKFSFGVGFNVNMPAHKRKNKAANKYNDDF